MRPSSLAIAFGAGRALFGVAMLAAPAPIARSWVGAHGAPASALTRALGGRDIAIGAGLALAAARGRDPSMWLAGGVLADTIDGIATVAAGDDIPHNGRVATAALAGGSALFGAWLARAVD
jgi:peptide-methionine (R)-S-oxide reductase